MSKRTGSDGISTRAEAVDALGSRTVDGGSRLYELEVGHSMGGAPYKRERLLPHRVWRPGSGWETVDDKKSSHFRTIEDARRGWDLVGDFLMEKSLMQHEQHGGNLRLPMGFWWFAAPRAPRERPDREKMFLLGWGILRRPGARKCHRPTASGEPCQRTSGFGGGEDWAPCQDHRGGRWSVFDQWNPL